MYSGPIGAVITPQYQGVLQDPWLPFASSLCGACAEVCPVEIEIPKLLLQLRSEVKQARTRQGQDRVERLAFKTWAWLMRHSRIYEMLGSMGSAALSGSSGWIRRLPGLLNRGPLRAWFSQRDLPPLAALSFRQRWRTRAKMGRN